MTADYPASLRGPAQNPALFIMRGRVFGITAER